jgi:MscS family membrane protein
MIPIEANGAAPRRRRDGVLALGREAARSRAARTAMVLLLLAATVPARAQFRIPLAPTPAASDAPGPDPYARETPRGSFFGFLQAIEKGNFRTAAAYLQLPASRRGAGEEIAHKLQIVFDHRLTTRSLDLVSRNPQGSRDDMPEPGLENVAEVRGDAGLVDVVLVREQRGEEGPIWLISWDTVRECLRLYQVLDLPDHDHELPPVLGKTRVAGVPLWQFGGLVLLLPILYAVSWLLVTAVLALVRLLRRRRLAPGSGWWAASARSPATFLLTLALHRYAVEWVGIPALYRLFYNRLILILLLAGLLWLLARLVDALDRSVLARFLPAGSSARHATLTLARRALKILAFLIVVVIGLAAFGVNLTATLAGLGIGGLVLAFAAQKSLENVFGGVAVLADRALRVGDTCRIGGVQGEVEDITLWATRLRTQERTVVSIPNGAVMTSQIENLARRDKFWFRPTVGLVYETTAAQMDSVLAGLRALLAADARVEPADARVQFVRLSSSSLDIEISAYVRAASQAAFQVVQEELLLGVLRVVAAAGTSLAFPSQTVYVAPGARPPDFGADPA